jgi:glycosyltransferase involved in cell wall biosynthesis
MVLPNDGTGGMQAQVRLISEALASSGSPVSILIGGGASTGTVEGVTYLAAPPLLQWFGIPFLRALRRHARLLRADVVHGHGLRTGPFVALARRQAKRFITCHGIDPDAIPRGLLRLLRILPVNVLACGSGPQALLRQFGLNVKLLENATPPALTPKSRSEFNQRFGTSNDDFVALWPARFSAQKDHGSLLAFAQCLRDTNVVVVCCGDGPLRAQLESRITALGLARHIRTVDFVSDAAAWLPATDFFLLPSKWEGQPLVLLESMRAGIPAVTWTGIGAELLPLSAHVASPEDGADRVRTWIEAPESARALGADLQKIAAGHELSIAISWYQSLYYSY